MIDCQLYTEQYTNRMSMIVQDKQPLVLRRSGSTSYLVLFGRMGVRESIVDIDIG